MPYANFCLVCRGTACESSKADQLYDEIKLQVAANSLSDQVQVLRTGCFGFCEQGPIVKVLPDEAFYVQVSPDDAEELVHEHLLKGRPVERLIYREPGVHALGNIEQISFYQKQFRIVLRNCGFIDPENIEEYIAREGYVGLERCLSELSPDDVIRELEDSGLRGRGGGGFPTWKKWKFTKDVQADQKYIVVNADEGDPGAYMDRSILEGDPHSIIESMVIAGYTTGADTGYVYVRAEYPLAIKRLQTALAQAEEYGLLGDNILGTDFSFRIEIRLGAGAFVCGEETALLLSIQGERGMPVQRPPYPAGKGLWGKPTVINNVETMAAIPAILTKGGKWFAKVGTETSKGTKVFALTGKVRNSGLIEVPMGIKLRDIVYNIGGGIPGDKKFKAVQSGGPSGGMISYENLDTEIDYETLTALGSMMGSGGLIVMDEDDSMVDVARFYLEFTAEESCGKCVPCRVGGKQILHLLEKIASGNGTMEDIKRIEEIGETMKTTSLCGLGKTAPNPALSALRFFRQEFMDAIPPEVREDAV